MASVGRVPVGIAMPQFFQEGPTDMELVRHWVTRAEELGFDSLWNQEDITGDDPSLEPPDPAQLRRGPHQPGAVGRLGHGATSAQSGATRQEPRQLGPDEQWPPDRRRRHRGQAEHVPRLSATLPTAGSGVSQKCWT